ncbi:MAG: OmpA family protein [Paludibacteraceae bacterium]|nr:OmpA family protein [Paludibacteraceae bacterium]
MKKFGLLTIIMVVALSVMPVSAATNKKKKHKSKAMTADEIRHYNQRRFDIHNIYVWGGAGYSGLVNKGTSWTDGINYTGDASSKFVGGGGGLLGVGYEYNYKRFILSVGPEFKVFSSMDRLDWSDPYQYTTGNAYDQIKFYDLQDVRETQVIGQITLPILLGMQLDKWYWKAGAKIGYSAFCWYGQKGTIQNTLRDPLAYEDWTQDIPHYNVGPVSLKQTGANPFGLDVALSAEIGVRLDKLLSDGWQQQNEDRDRPMRMRLAVFADYGVPDLSVEQKGTPFAQLDANAMQTSSWQGSEWGSSKLNSLLVGVKFTWMLQMNKVKDEKKQNGCMVLYAFDTKSQRAIPSVAMQIKNMATGRTYKKVTGSRGMLVKREPAGDFQISATKEGYLSVENRPFHHSEVNDTLSLGMRPIPVFRYVVTDAKTNQPLAATVTFLDAATGEVVLTAQSGTNGNQTTAMLPVDGNYNVRVEASDYYAFTDAVADIDGEMTYRLEPIVKKRAIVLRNLFFATNETTILPESEQSLQDLYELLSENPEIRIRITGHTDDVGSDRDNQILSEGRANSVRQAMIDRGIDASRIEAEGKGESEPVATNETEEGRQQNRRVEFMVL